MTRYIYTARLVPLRKPVRIPFEDGGPSELQTFTDKSFELERTSKPKPEIWIDHDRALRCGQVVMLFASRDWICCDFMLDRDLPADIYFDVGQPVSVGLSQLKIGSRGTFLREVSVVRRGAVPGAEITERSAIKPTAPTAPAAPTPASPPSAREEIFHGGPIIRRNIGTVTAVGGRPLRTRAGEPIRYLGDDIVVDRPDGTQVIFCGREGRADFAREHGRGVRA